MTNNFFLISGKNLPKIASAFVPKGTPIELSKELEDIHSLPFELQLVRLSHVKTGIITSDDLEGIENLWLDYQINNRAWPLFSKQLKDVIEQNLTGNEGIDWISAKINGKGEQRTYYILKFTKMLDVLDTDKTLFMPNTDNVIRPCFSISKISHYSVFHKPNSNGFWKITAGIYINEKLKKAIQKEGLSGISFEKTRVA